MFENKMGEHNHKNLSGKHKNTLTGCGGYLSRYFVGIFLHKNLLVWENYSQIFREHEIQMIFGIVVTLSLVIFYVLFVVFP